MAIKWTGLAATGRKAKEPYVEIEIEGKVDDPSSRTLTCTFYGKHAPSYLFAGAKGIDRLVFAEGCEEIGSMVALNAEGIKEVVLPASLKYMGTMALGGCKVSSLRVPTSLCLREGTDDPVLAAASAFNAMSELKEVAFFETTPGEIPDGLSLGTFEMAGQKIETIRVPWAEGAVPGAPWGAYNGNTPATVIYNYKGE